MTPEQPPADLALSYDRIAPAYARAFGEDMAKKAFDCRLLDWLGDKVAGLGPICDLGCGPGLIAGYLHARGLETCGIDLSPAMVEQAQARYPEIPFSQGNLQNLSAIPDQSFGGIAAFYSLIHTPPAAMVAALTEIHRVLKPGGTFLLSFHLGNESIHKQSWFDQPVSLDFHLFERPDMKDWLTQAGFQLEEAIERDPYPGLEVETRRAYLFARKA